MKNIVLLSAFTVIIFASCSTAFKSGQTPDDLYYAKRTVTEENTVQTRREVVEEPTYEDRVIRMASYDQRWRTLDYDYDYDCHYSPYNYGYTYGYYYNPYYYTYPVYSLASTYHNPKNTTIRMVNLNSYSNTVTTYTPTKTSGNTRTYNTRGYNNTNVITPRYNTGSSSNETRTYSPAPASSNSGSPSGNTSSGTSTGRPARGN